MENLNFYTSVKPFCDFARICGVFPYSSKGPARDGKFKLNFKGIFCTLISLCLIVVVLSKALDIGTKQSKQKLLEAKVWCWILILGTAFTLISFVYQNFHLKEILEFFCLLDNCDSKLKSLNLEIDHKKERKFNFHASFLGIFGPISYLFFMTAFNHHFGLGLGLHWNLLYMHFLLYKSFFCVQFIVITNAIRERFEAMSSLLM